VLQEIVQLASSLIRIPSFNPPGNENAIMTFAATWLEHAGISSEPVFLEPGRSSLVARIVGTQSGSIVLCGHLDTVTADKDVWQNDPFNPVVERGRLWGLGAADMKSAVAVLMQAMALRIVRASSPEKSLVLVLTADEEWGYRGAATVAQSGLIDDAELILIAEPTSNVVCNGQKGELWIEATFTGREAHGSMPQSGANAILPAARFCTRLKDALDQWPEDPVAGRTTLNVGRFAGGRQVNIVPGHAHVQLDVRVVSEAHHESVIDLISTIGEEQAAASGTQFSCQIMSYHPPIRFQTEHAFARKLLALSQAATGNRQRPLLSPYSTDGVSFAPKFDVPILICGPGSIEQAHQPDEWIDIRQIEQALEIVTSFIA